MNIMDKIFVSNPCKCMCCLIIAVMIGLIHVSMCTASVKQQAESVTNEREMISTGTADESSDTGRENSEQSLSEEIVSATSDELLLFTDIPAIEITTASKKEQKLQETPAAVYVVTAEDIRRSGVTSVMDALRMVPGMFVGRSTSNIWSIASRGFARQYVNNLLVLVDGRSVYTPLFAGVYWSLQDMVLQDIERIEVIRGPGGTLWGANAVNGVINIITKKAKDTQGMLLSGIAGSEIIGQGVARYGGVLGEHTHFRLFSKYTVQDHYGDTLFDPSQMSVSGFRIDSDVSPEDALTLIGGWKEGFASNQSVGFRLIDPIVLSQISKTRFVDRYILSRWRHLFSERSDMTFQFYYNRGGQNSDDGGEFRDTWDLDFQHRFEPFDRHELIWGLGYRYSIGHFHNNPPLGYFSTYDFDPLMRADTIFSGFIQDEIALVEDRLKLIVGSKFEYNDYTGFEYQPSGRLVWTPDDRHTVWGSISRAVRTPFWAEDDILVRSVFDAGGTPAVFSINGNDDLKSETVLSYELGNRTRWCPDVYTDVVGFFSKYNHQTTAEPQGMSVEMDPSPHLEIPTVVENLMHGHSWGVEASANWDITKDWRVSGSYSFIDVQVDNVNQDVRAYFDCEGSTPHNQLNVRSYMNFPHNIEVDTMAYYVDNLSEEQTPHYIRLDVRVGWKPTENVELSFAAQNLLDHDNKEFGPSDLEFAEVPRSLYGQLTIRF